MLDWEKLLNPVRRKELDGSKETIGTGVGRTELERDYDRILFAAPTRRLADKTQVFPMEENDSVRTRLTHSHEVSNLARSIGVRLAFEHAEKIFGPNHEELQVKRNIPPLLAAVGLAHDLGNPPFGHQGEMAMQQWFQESAAHANAEPDFLEFDGNAQTFRLLVRLQILNDKFGLNLTVATLAALIKYPSIYGEEKFKFKKYGIFKSELSIIQEIWAQTGLQAGVRHPLAYIMEACDDIAYSIIDAEDTVKKGYASFYDLMDYLQSHDKDDPVINRVVNDSRKENEKFKKSDLSSKELNDLSMQMFRVKAISEMIVSATNEFVNRIDEIMSGTPGMDLELIKVSNCSKLCKATKDFDKRHGFQHRDVLRLELQGNNHIKSMMNILWEGINNEEDQKDPFSRFVYGTISENYRRIYKATDKSTYDKSQLLCDALSGMTESFLIKRLHEYKSLSHVK